VTGPVGSDLCPGDARPEHKLSPVPSGRCRDCALELGRAVSVPTAPVINRVEQIYYPVFTLIQAFDAMQYELLASSLNNDVNNA
jgi:hypothetical protein